MISALDYRGTNLFADIVRIALIFVPASLIVGATAMVLMAYFAAYKSEKFKAAHRGLLPYHVVLISISYICLIVDEVLVVYSRRATDFNVHSVLLIPAFLCGLAALWTVLRFERRRYDVTRQINEDIDDES